MSRGGRGGARGGKRGPDMSWDDEESSEPIVNNRKPGPLFPDRYLPGPKPLTPAEKAHIKSYMQLRDRMRKGPLYTMLDPTLAVKPTSSIASQSKVHQQSISAKRNPRAGFDPFNDQENRTNKSHRKRRYAPDLTGRDGYTLHFFPRELWPVLDPKQHMEEWAKLGDEEKARILGGSSNKSRKRKRAEAALRFDEEDESTARNRKDSDASDDDDEDALSPSTRRRKKTSAQDRRKKAEEARSAARQKKGLDAEDDYPDVDQQDEDGEGGAGGAQGGAEDEPVDSEFGTDDDDDDGGDDYNGEGYFDNGDDEVDLGGDGDGDDDGGGGGGYY